MLTRVNELIDPVTDDSDENLIRDNFWHIDVECIWQIPTNQHGTEDCVTWHFTKSGVVNDRPTIGNGKIPMLTRSQSLLV